MQMTYSADVDHIDEPLELAASERSKPEEPIRIRLQPSIFRPGLRQQRFWAGVSWTVDCQDVAEAVGLREALRCFFEAVQKHGPRAVMQALIDAPTSE